MLMIRQDQMREMQAYMDESYCHELKTYFRAEYPNQTEKWDDQSLFEIIKNSVHRARQIGVESGEAMRRYVGLAILVNPDFDKEHEVQVFFESPNLDPDYKVHLLSDLLIEKLNSV